MGDAEANFDVDTFLEHVRAHECIWNSSCEGFRDKAKRYNAWIEIADALRSDFKKRSLSRRNEIVKFYQRKWKIMRDGHSRYMKKISISTLDGVKIRPYALYHQMAFLRNESSDTLDHIDARALDGENTQYSILETVMNAQKRKYDEVVTHENPIDESTQNEADKWFLISLTNDFSKIPDRYKLDAKAEIIEIIKKYKAQSEDVNNTQGEIGDYNRYPNPMESQSNIREPKVEINSQGLQASEIDSDDSEGTNGPFSGFDENAMI